MSKKVHKLGLRPPTQNADLVAQQMRLAWEYKRDMNAPLCALRTARRALQSSPEIRAAEVAYDASKKIFDAVYGELKVIRKNSKRRSESAALTAAVTAARAVKRQAQNVLKQLRADHRAAVKAEEERTGQKGTDRSVNIFNAEECRIRRGLVQRGLYWGNYQRVYAALKAADKMALYDWENPTTTTDPKVPRWDRSGSTAVHFQDGGGISLAELYHLKNTQARIEFTPDLYEEEFRSKKTHQLVGGGKNRARFGTLYLRVGSEPDRSPIWATFPLKMHRPIPDQAIVKWIVVSLSYLGPFRQRWEVDITVEEPERSTDLCGHGVVAVDLGWRTMDDHGIRVITWRDEFGASGSFRFSEPTQEQMLAYEKKMALYPAKKLRATASGKRCKAPARPRSIREQIDYAGVLRSIRDTDLDSMKKKFLAKLPEELPLWLRMSTQGKEDAEVPSSAQARAYLEKRKSFGRWARLAADQHWGKNCPEVLTAWAKQDRHLWDFEVNQRSKVYGRRREETRVFAAEFSRRYDTILLESDPEETKLMDLRVFARKKHSEKKAENKTARHNRQIFAPGVCRQDIVSAFNARRGTVGLISSVGTSATCPYCGHVNKRSAEETEAKAHPCGNCGQIWDSGDGCCQLLLKRYAAKLAHGEALNTPEKAKEKKKQQQKPRLTRWECRRAKQARQQALGAAPPQEVVKVKAPAKAKTSVPMRCLGPGKRLLDDVVDHGHCWHRKCVETQLRDQT